VSSFVVSRLPSPTEIVELPEDALGLMLLRLAHDDQQGHLLTRSLVANASYWGAADMFGMEGTKPQFLQAMAEAWDWLDNNGLVALRPGEHSADGHAYITRRGHRVLEASEPMTLLRAEERINVDLHPRIADRVRRQFLLGEYEPAAFIALREVEIRLRELAGASESDIGVALAQQALKVGGPLADPNLDAGEQQATMALFWGALGVFKNPTSHRQVDYADSTVASEVILLGDLLLRMLDDVEARVAPKKT
jgi:uncharacterized protein (TIGR02391 family)